MNGARDQFLSRASFAQNQHGGAGRRGQFHLRKRAAKGRAIANDFLEIEFAANFFFEVKFLDRQLVFQRIDFLERQRIFQRDGNLCRDLLEKLHIGSVKLSDPGWRN